MNPLVIGVAGGTGSGKSTVAAKIVEGLPSQSVVILDHDSYYRDRSDLTPAMAEQLNYDHPDSLRDRPAGGSATSSEIGAGDRRHAAV